jgi:hypothetical protein
MPRLSFLWLLLLLLLLLLSLFVYGDFILVGIVGGERGGQESQRHGQDGTAASRRDSSRLDQGNGPPSERLQVTYSVGDSSSFILFFFLGFIFFAWRWPDLYIYSLSIIFVDTFFSLFFLFLSRLLYICHCVCFVVVVVVVVAFLLFIYYPIKHADSPSHPSH